MGPTCVRRSIATCVLSWLTAGAAIRPEIAGRDDDWAMDSAGMSERITEIFNEREADRYDLHAEYLNEQMVRVLRAIIRRSGTP